MSAELLSCISFCEFLSNSYLFIVPILFLSCRFPGSSFDITIRLFRHCLESAENSIFSMLSQLPFFGSEMELELLGKIKSLLRWKCFINRTCRMGVEIVLYNPNGLCFRIFLSHFFIKWA